MGDWTVSEIWITVIVTIVGLIMSLDIVKKFFSNIQDRTEAWRLGEVYAALKGGVERTYHLYVKGIKAASEDGKLNAKEEKNARWQATDYARTQLAKINIDLIKEFGLEWAHSYIRGEIHNRKRAAGGLGLRQRKGQ